MPHRPSSARLASIALVALISAAATGAAAQSNEEDRSPPAASVEAADSASRASAPRTSTTRARRSAIHISTRDRWLWVVAGTDTLMSVPVGVASGERLVYAGRAWTFRTPRGRHTVLRKRTDPIWTPPDWMYAEAAMDNRLRLAHMPKSGTVRISGGRRLMVRDGQVVLRTKEGELQPLPIDEHIVFDGTLYIPPVNTRNRRLHGQLGDYALDLGNGYMLHGTSNTRTIGRAVSHGCIRLHDVDLEWLYHNIRVGTPVYIR
jgi:lipoprotein-anchoring transpeptidase ErfK/SrfK